MSSTTFYLQLEGLLAGTSQAQLARRLGVSPQLVSDWKRGRRTPSPDQLFAIERALDVKPGQLSRHLGYVPTDAEAAAIDGLLVEVRARARALAAQLPDELVTVTRDLDELAARAAERGLAAELLRLAVQDFEREHGALTDDELRIAEERLTAASGVASTA